MKDFLIIGGGIAGASVAARVAPLGSTTLLEGEDALGYHASGRSAAMFEEQYGLPSTIVLNQASAEYHRTAHGGFLSPRGLMLVARPDQAMEFAKDIKSLSMMPIQKHEALKHVPILDPAKIGFAAYHEAAYDLDTDRMIQTFASSARADGAEILTKQHVTAITRTEQGWRVSTKGEDHEARILINAAGAWVDEVAKMAGVRPLGFTPNRRSMARLPAPGEHDISSWPMLMGVEESWYAKPDAGKWLVSPAEEDPVEPHDAWADDMVLAEGIARYEEMVTEPVTRLETSWAGLRTFSPDRALVIGFDVNDPVFFWHAGQGGYGFQTAPAASQLAADTIAGRAPQIDAETVAALRPERFA